MYRAPLDDNLKSALSFDAHAVCLSFGKKNISTKFIQQQSKDNKKHKKENKKEETKN